MLFIFIENHVRNIIMNYSVYHIYGMKSLNFYSVIPGHKESSIGMFQNVTFH